MQILQAITEEATSYVNNSKHFVNLIKDIKLDPDDTFANPDVVSLYPSIPIDKAFELKNYRLT